MVNSVKQEKITLEITDFALLKRVYDIICTQTNSLSEIDKDIIIQFRKLLDNLNAWKA